MSGDILPFKATERTLPNGLKVIVVPTGFPNIVSLQIPVQTGSRNEVEPGKSGFAHFFEHMMFRGTKAYPPEKYQAILTRAGARQNAYTTDDYTNYHTTFAKEDLETILEIEADRFQNLDYPEAAFRTEARAVLGEYNKNSANPISKLFEVDARHRLHDAHLQAHHDGLPQGHRGHAQPVRVLEDVLRPLVPARVHDDHRRGRRGPGEGARRSSRSTGAAGSAGATPVEIPRSRAPKGPIYVHVPWPTPTLPWVAVAFHGPAFSETAKDWAALDMLLDLAFGQTSDLYRKLVEKEQKVDQLFAVPPGQRRPAARSRGRARQEAGGRRLRPRPDPRGRSPPWRTSRSTRSRSPRPSPTPATRLVRASTTPRRSPAPRAATSAPRARTGR